MGWQILKGWASLGVTCTHLVSLGLTLSRLVSLGLAWTHLVSPGLLLSLGLFWIHWKPCVRTETGARLAGRTEAGEQDWAQMSSGSLKPHKNSAEVSRTCTGGTRGPTISQKHFSNNFVHIHLQQPRGHAPSPSPGGLFSLQTPASGSRAIEISRSDSAPNLRS